MHELPVTQNIFDIVNEEALKNGAKKVKEIKLVVGEFTGIIDESVQMYFDMLSKNTIQEGAKLIFKRIKAQFLCTKCNKHFEISNGNYDCSVCKKRGVSTDIGKEFYIESIEVE